MSPAEVAYRVEEKRRRLIARRAPGAGQRAVTERPVLPSVPGLRLGVDFIGRDPQVASRWRRQANQLAEGSITALGQAWPLDERGLPDWSLDPVSRRRWPEAFAFDVDYRTPHDLGDVKYVWEINRLQYLQSIAASARVEDNVPLGQLCAAHLIDWISHQSPMRSVAWASGIELALRVVSMLTVTTLVADAFDSESSSAVVQSLCEHGYWIERFPSRYSSANNHRVAELGALFLLGVTLPGDSLRERWATTGRRGLEAEAGRQILDDGAGAEQSPTYEAFTLEWLGLCAAVADALGAPFTDAYRWRLRLGAEHLLALTDAKGNMPHIGDDDEGRVLADGSDVDYAQSVACALLSGGNTTPQLSLRPPQTRLRNALLGTASSTCQPPRTMRTFESGGYSTVREFSSAGTEILWVFDHGPVGYLSIAAHGHADALAVWLHVGGEPVFVDAGTFSYHADHAEREFFRSTRAHSTALVDDLEQSVQAGPFNWRAKAAAVLLDSRRDLANWSLTGEHDGYRKRLGVGHRRTLSRMADGTYAIRDELIGDDSTTHSVEIGFVVAPTLRAETTRDGWSLRTESDRVADLAVLSEGDVLCDTTEVPYSARFGQRQLTQRLRARVILAPGSPLTTSIVIHDRLADELSAAAQRPVATSRT